MSGTRDIRNFALIGFMGSGKTTVGRLIAHQLQFDFVDTDHLLERRAGKTIARIFAEDGEATFRRLEQEVVSELAQRDRTVIATGGGLGANPDNLARLRTHALIVCLWATTDVIWERVRRQSHRPLLQGPNPRERIGQLLAERTPTYRQADVLMNTGLRPLREIAQQAVHHFLLARRGESAR